jgi:hypothetical protein
MRRKRLEHRREDRLVLVQLLLDGQTVDTIDQAGRVLGLDRCGVLLEAFKIMSRMYAESVGHGTHAGCSVSL